MDNWTKEEVKEIEDAEFSMLDEPEIKRQYLDLGNIGNLWYYGLKRNQGMNLIVYSDKTTEYDHYECPNCAGIIYSASAPNQCGCGCKKRFKRLFPSKFDVDGYLGDIMPRWSKQWAREWLKGNLTLEKNKIYAEIRDLINYFMDFGEKDYYADVQACWIMATYVYPLFYWFPNILFKAPSGSGKSKNGKIMMYLSFGGFDLGTSGGATPPQLFRTLEGNRGTIFLDELEKNEKSETYRYICQLINAGATRDSYIIRNEQIKKKWVAKKFPIFCPKIVCSISGINPTSMSRFIPFELLRNSDKEKGRRKPERQEEIEKFDFIRNRIHPLMLEQWKNIKTTESMLNLELTGRDEDNWRPILTIAKWIGEDIYNKILKVIPNFQEIQIIQNDDDLILFQTLLENVSKEGDFYTPKQIALWMDEDYQDLFKSTAALSKSIGWKLKRYNLKHAARGAKGYKYKLSKKLIQDIIERYFSTEKTTLTTLHTLNTLNTKTTQDKSVVNVENVEVEDVKD